MSLKNGLDYLSQYQNDFVIYQVEKGKTKNVRPLVKKMLTIQLAIMRW